MVVVVVVVVVAGAVVSTVVVIVTVAVKVNSRAANAIASTYTNRKTLVNVIVIVLISEL